jgi:hypothetical protein
MNRQRGSGKAPYYRLSRQEVPLLKVDCSARITVFVQLINSISHNVDGVLCLTGAAMPRLSKERIKADLLRARVVEILKEPDWLDEGVRFWLEKLPKRPSDYIYTDNEHSAVARIIAAGTLFDEWDGYSVTELRKAACQYMADGDEEDERLLGELEGRNATRLRLGEMGHLVGFCRNVAGVALAPFRPLIATSTNIGSPS